MSKIIDDIKLEYKIGNIVYKFIYWNIAIYLVSLYFYQWNTGGFDFPDWLALTANPSTVLKYSWTLISYAFLHFEFRHIFSNMLMLLFSGQYFMTYFSKKQFVGLYFLSAIFVGLCYIMAFQILNYYPDTKIVGASGIIFAILFAVTTYNPFMDINLFFIGKIKLIYVTFVFVLLMFMEDYSRNMGGFISHLSGAFFGFLYIKLLQNGVDLSEIVTKIIAFFVHLFDNKQKTPFKKVYKNNTNPNQKPISKTIIKDKTQQQIDEILDKISKSGYDSLTGDEKEFLFKAGK